MARPPSIAARVVRWQRRHGRHDLPWQRSRDPYRVWLSEIMLQQTQVATVLAYFERFVARLPSVQALAAAPLDEVLSLWSGLGYYSRARHLHRCAQRVVQEHGGSFPASSLELARLPGIGRSTAAAIAVFCFGERAAILDGNVKRVLARVLGFGGDLATAAGQNALWSRAEQLLPARGVDVYTQGLMDLGATVCTSRRPRCEACPLSACCAARAAGRPMDFPVKRRGTKRKAVASAWLWLEHGDRVWLVQRPLQGIWAGLWSLPEADRIEDLEALVRSWPGHGDRLEPIVHALTHRDWTLEPLRWRLPTRLSSARLAAVESALGAGRWWTRVDAQGLGLPAPARRLLGV